MLSQLVLIHELCFHREPDYKYITDPLSGRFGDNDKTTKRDNVITGTELLFQNALTLGTSQRSFLHSRTLSTPLTTLLLQPKRETNHLSFAPLRQIICQQIEMLFSRARNRLPKPTSLRLASSRTSNALV
jgi:hypothetical protein